MRENPTEFAEYHAVAEEAESADPPETRPPQVIAELIKRHLPEASRILDAGCGVNPIQWKEGMSGHEWRAIDVATTPETAEIAEVMDIGAMRQEARQFEGVVLSRSLWAHDRERVLREVQRVLQRRGLLFVCEARSEKWWDTENKKNLLKELLERVGFEIVSAVGEDIGDAEGDGMWQYFVARR